ncbi:hypothetical protein A4D02_14460 [Niastella koreensis]|uniref:KWG Leptospira repeat protein n=2 Tax=Niastella koreensis TaxID=354356 RepID=G8T9A3_NIAKG|nr:hypothetical protein [Niastella koreensis]AEV98071.1 hypothetical protein Niako_1707 [Niastella koreensis GR20-10]OQP40132.1 hypothetical protein A4D02_14460 [Niastella koreensis]
MKQINDVLSWLLLKQELLYIDSKQNQFCVDFLNSTSSEKYDLRYEPFAFFQVSDNGFIIIDGGNRPSSFYKENKLQPFEVKETGSLVNQDQDPEFLVFFKTEEGKKVYKLFEWRNKRVVVESKSRFTVVKDKAFSIIDEMLCCYNLTGELNWQYPTSGKKSSEQIEIKKIIGMFGYDLWIQLSDESFLCLNALTGKALHPHMILKEILGLDGLAIGEVHLDEESGKIRILAFSYYIEIDLATRMPAIKAKFESGWSIGKGRFYDGDMRAYFIADYPFHGKKIGNFTAGVFNTETLEIEWHYSLSGEDKHHFFVNQPQANEKFFAVKDTNDTLYLFERGVH